MPNLCSSSINLSLHLSTLPHKKTSMAACRNHNIFKKERLQNTVKNAVTVLFYTVILSLLITFYLLYYPRTINYTAKINGDYNQTTILAQPHQNSSRKSCDLFKGQWISDKRGSLYTNYSCKTIPYKRNCFLNGREDREFLNWRWKPEECELPRFSPKSFLSTVEGKTMAFIGDSVARNQMESLLCLLSTIETPKQVDKDAEDKFTTWEFPEHNFTLMALWSQFLVIATERVVNGSSTGGFDLQLDKVDRSWSEKLPLMDYIIFSDAHWFFRQNYLYEGGSLIGCVYCQAPNLTDLGPNFAIKRAFQTAFEKINQCDNCKKIFTVLRTYSPSHFENGTWNTGGGCNRTRPMRKEDIVGRDSDWEYKNIQGEEVEKARVGGEDRGNKFEILDITEIMVVRGDGHPGIHWGNQWMKGYSDCIHWCMPGPIDTWNELLLEMIKR